MNEYAVWIAKGKLGLVLLLISFMSYEERNVKKEIIFVVVVIISSLVGYFIPSLTAEKTMLWSSALSLILFHTYQRIINAQKPSVYSISRTA